MRSTARRWRRAALGAVLLAGAPAALGASSLVAAAEPSALIARDGPCVGDSGVTVVVDFGTLGGGSQTRCAPEPVSTGFDALSGAGFTYAGTTRYPGLLCRIDGKPSPQQEACQNAPPPGYYWAYWTAPAPGGTWTYSDQGAGNRDPAPGSVEGWAFSDGCTRQPGASSSCATTSTTSTTSPTAAASTTQAPTAASPPAETDGTAATAADAFDVVATVPGGGDDGAEGVDAAAPPSENSAGSPEGLDDLDGNVALGARQNDPRARPAASGSGSPTGVMVGAAIMVVLGLSAIARNRRRSLSTSGPGTE